MRTPCALTSWAWPSQHSAQSCPSQWHQLPGLQEGPATCKGWGWGGAHHITLGVSEDTLPPTSTLERVQGKAHPQALKGDPAAAACPLSAVLGLGASWSCRGACQSLGAWLFHLYQPDLLQRGHQVPVDLGGGQGGTHLGCKI